jgi:copper chaperone CopZ
MEQTYEIEGMHCASCVGKIKAALEKYARDVTVTLSPPRATLVDQKRGVSGLDLEHAVAAAGKYQLRPLPASAASTSHSEDVEERSWITTYYPLILIAGFIAVASLAGATSFPAWMTNFMAGFFLVFSAFKLLDLKGFADAYATYDLLAKRWHGYGFIYPFIELVLGLSYLFRLNPPLTDLATVIVMGFSSLGVIDALRNKRKIQCACLGTVLNLPMSTITLVEDLGMVAMAAATLALGHN